MKFRQNLLRLLYLLLFIIFLYGLGRLYFHVTAGFTIENISSDFTYQPDWEVKPLNESENKELTVALAQPYFYLSKGCQSYVFISQDGQYVIKFFKYQRFRLQPWLQYFPPLPAFVAYREEKKEKKWQKLNSFIVSWKIVAEQLRDESGLVYVHLNKTTHLNKILEISDKIGMKHKLDLDQMEFCVQRRADMLCDVLLKYKNRQEGAKAQLLIDQLLALILSEYARGLADNDHALMQNTGVAKDKPIHIDVGRFEVDEEMKNPAKYKQEFFTKTFRFKQWLAKHYPEMHSYLEDRLIEIIGPDYFTMQPIWFQKPERKA